MAPPPNIPYFFGYSLGGYQSITEARRYPEDYDGISSGKPIPSFVFFNAEQLWPAWLIAKDPAKFIPKEKYAMIQEVGDERVRRAGRGERRPDH